MAELCNVAPYLPLSPALSLYYLSFKNSRPEAIPLTADSQLGDERILCCTRIRIAASSYEGVERGRTIVNFRDLCRAQLSCYSRCPYRCPHTGLGTDRIYQYLPPPMLPPVVQEKEEKTRVCVYIVRNTLYEVVLLLTLPKSWVYDHYDVHVHSHIRAERALTEQQRRQGWQGWEGGLQTSTTVVRTKKRGHLSLCPIKSRASFRGFLLCVVSVPENVYSRNITDVRFNLWPFRLVQRPCMSVCR